MDDPTRILLLGNRHRTAAIRSLQKAANQLACAGNLSESLAALQIARTVTNELVVRYEQTITAVKARQGAEA